MPTTTKRKSRSTSSIKFLVCFPHKGRRKSGHGESQIQEVMFYKSRWTPARAKAWLKKNKFRYGKMDDKPTTLRFPQRATTRGCARFRFVNPREAQK